MTRKYRFPFQGKDNLADRMASDLRVNTPCGLERPGQKVKSKTTSKIYFLVFHLKTIWADSLPVITQYILLWFVGHEVDISLTYFSWPSYFVFILLQLICV